MAATPDIEVVVVPIGGEPPENWHTILDEAERRRAEAFHFQRDRDRFINAHLALRAMLGRRLAHSPASLAFATGKHGKPRLAGGSGIEFNLSHSEDWAAVAMADGLALGVDVEAPREIRDVGDLAASIMSPQELEAFRALPDPSMSRALLEVWTRKEACLKAWGLGLQVAPRRVHVAFAAGGNVDVAAPSAESAPAQVHSINTGDKLTLAVAALGPIGRISLTESPHDQRD